MEQWLHPDLHSPRTHTFAHAIHTCKNKASKYSTNTKASNWIWGVSDCSRWVSLLSAHSVLVWLNTNPTTLFPNNTASFWCEHAPFPASAPETRTLSFALRTPTPYRLPLLHTVHLKAKKKKPSESPTGASFYLWFQRPPLGKYHSCFYIQNYMRRGKKSSQVTSLISPTDDTDRIVTGDGTDALLIEWHLPADEIWINFYTNFWVQKCIPLIGFDVKRKNLLALLQHNGLSTSPSIACLCAHLQKVISKRKVLISVHQNEKWMYTSSTSFYPALFKDARCFHGWGYILGKWRNVPSERFSSESGQWPCTVLFSAYKMLQSICCVSSQCRLVTNKQKKKKREDVTNDIKAAKRIFLGCTERAYEHMLAAHRMKEEQTSNPVFQSGSINLREH